jgi:cation diffusion facilitator family transporter
LQADRTRRVQSAANLSFGFNLVQTGLKLTGALLTGSVSLLSEALHSVSDVISSFVSLVSVRAAAAPPDDEHPYGHGKIDTLAGLSEAIILFLFALYTAGMAVIHFFEKPVVGKLDWGLAIVSVCAAVGFFVMRVVQKIAKETGSFALASNAQHIQVDIVTTLGVVASLLVTKFIGWPYADPLFALGLSLWLGFSSVKMIHAAFDQVIDKHIDPEELNLIQSILNEQPELISYHKLRTRHSGEHHFVEMHIVVPRDWNVVQAHDLADRIEKRVESDLAPCICTIHVDPDVAKTSMIAGDEPF